MQISRNTKDVHVAQPAVFSVAMGNCSCMHVLRALLRELAMIDVAVGWSKNQKNHPSNEWQISFHYTMAQASMSASTENMSAGAEQGPNGNAVSV